MVIRCGKQTFAHLERASISTNVSRDPLFEKIARMVTGMNTPASSDGQKASQRAFDKTRLIRRQFAKRAKRFRRALAKHA
jgi:hypothetical protein